ncbi:hypothetical protein TSUD_163030 [Trifolium subterraneum]|uniref:Endonuclease/exonuclease/phosphatase domain-containing protein n=1 Tax=Trifolium subterraneum TaxID=3900 RepID=A0A2Z6N5G5_TRISU|nr:hypothetical protein TSUD_163030 [Trifolium subterraneum]
MPFQSVASERLQSLPISVLQSFFRTEQGCQNRTSHRTGELTGSSALCSSIWGTSPHAFSYRPSVGASGGMLTLWDSTEVDVWVLESHEHVLWCHGQFIKSEEEFSTLGRSRVCVCGDFNVVGSVGERRSVSGRPRSLDHIAFNYFSDDNILIDLPLCGRIYTWFKGHSLSMSRLDRFLLFGEWCLTWPNCSQVARMRGLSDHCPLVLSANEDDWGPRTGRMLKSWKDVPRYNLFVKDKWNSLQVDGWGGFVLKEKFKMIKLALKDWHQTHTETLPSILESLKDRLAALDEKWGEEDLAEEELTELHGTRRTFTRSHG